MSLSIDPKTTALVLIDLQHGIVALPTTPRSGAEVVATCAPLAQKFRDAGAFVVLVRVGNAPDGKDFLNPATDGAPASAAGRPANWSELVPEIGPKDGDHVVLKRQWGAFTGTDLDVQLRRRGIKTIVLAGIATNIGVESTARFAIELGYDQIFVEDGMSSLFPDGHAFCMKTVFPRMGKIRSAAEVIAALPGK